jgi:hypothetical protein
MGYAADQSPTVSEAKQNLRDASSQIDLLAPVKNHPISSIALALTAGYVAQKALSNNGAGKSLIPSFFSLGLLVAKRLLLK